jgi:hypothetical protein
VTHRFQFAAELQGRPTCVKTNLDARMGT